MDIFLLYLIQLFTKDNSEEDRPSLAFVENSDVIKGLVHEEIEMQEAERLQRNFKMQLTDYINSVIKADALDQNIGTCFIDMNKSKRSSRVNYLVSPSTVTNKHSSLTSEDPAQAMMN